MILRLHLFEASRRMCKERKDTAHNFEFPSPVRPEQGPVDRVEGFCIYSLGMNGVKKCHKKNLTWLYQLYQYYGTIDKNPLKSEMLMIKKFIAFKGNQFTIEWYFDSREKSSSLEYFQGLSMERQKKVLNLLSLLAEMGKIFNKEKFRYEGD